MDLDDTPEQAAYRAQVRSWLEEHKARSARSCRARARSRTRIEIIAARRAWQGKLAEGGLAGRDLAEGVRRPGPRPDRAGDLQPGDRARESPRHPRRDRRRHARPDDHRPRHRGAEVALPRADAPRRRGLVPAVLRARRRLGSGGRADPRAPAGRRQLAADRPEGVDDQRPVRLLRAAARAHRRRRAQAQGPDDVHRADGRRGRDRARPAPDLRRGRVQRGLLRRRRARRRRGRRRRRQRLGHGADDADVRARHDRPRRRGHRLQLDPLRRARSPPTSTPAATPRCATSSARSQANCSPCASPATAR